MTFLIILCILLVVALSIETYYIFSKKRRITKNTTNIVEELTKIKTEDNFVLDKEHDDILINNYLSIINQVLKAYDSSRSKMVSFRTRRLLLYETIMIIPIISKTLDISFEYDTTSKILSKKSDRDIMLLLKEAYNSYSLESQESFNDMILCVLLLSDNK